MIIYNCSKDDIKRKKVETMTRKQLLSYIESCLRYCANSSDPDNQKSFFAQAFGALDFYLSVNQREYDELHKIWEDYRERFYKIIYGV
jgi:hypothetical protein